MKRLILLIALAALSTLADSKPVDPKQEIFDLFTKIASELSADNPMVFLESVDHDMPRYHDFENTIVALTNQDDLTISIETLSDKGDNNRRVQELDWFMQVVDKGDSTDAERRREVVKVSLERRGKKWKIESIEPLSFFAPPKVK